jgi:hypothetical protein
MLCDHSRYQTLEAEDLCPASSPGSVARQRVLVPGKALSFIVGCDADVLVFEISWAENAPQVPPAPPLRVERACDARTQPPNRSEEFTLMTTNLGHYSRPLVWII